MPCPHFRSGPHVRCGAVREELVPSLHEREHFCVGGRPEHCPTYQAFQHAGGPISEELYFRLWLPPRGTEQTVHTDAAGVCT